MKEFEEKDSLQMTCDLEEKLLCELISEVCGKNPKRIVEIGTFKGHCTRSLRNIFPETIIYTIDLFPGLNSDWGQVKNVGQCFEEERDRIIQIFRKSFEEIPIEAEVWIVDADHRYESCLQDSKLAMRYATHLIVWHDYTNPNYGVKGAVIEITNGRAKILKNSCFAFLKK